MHHDNVIYVLAVKPAGLEIAQDGQAGLPTFRVYTPIRQAGFPAWRGQGIKKPSNALTNADIKRINENKHKITKLTAFANDIWNVSTGCMSTSPRFHHHHGVPADMDKVEVMPPVSSPHGISKNYLYTVPFANVQMAKWTKTSCFQDFVHTPYFKVPRRVPLFKPPCPWLHLITITSLPLSRENPVSVPNCRQQHAILCFLPHVSFPLRSCPTVGGWLRPTSLYSLRTDGIRKYNPAGV